MDSRAATKLSALLAPLAAGGVTLRNRSVMGSMHTGLESGWGSATKLSAFYAERARGGVGLIVTGGYSPNFSGRLAPLSSQFSKRWQLGGHRQVAAAVHREGGRIALQLLHAGRYAYHPFSRAPSAVRAPINPFTPKAIGTRGIERTIRAFGESTKLAREAGYDGVEIMGSEGYFIHEFLCARTNQRNDEWGGDFARRKRLAIEIVKEARARAGEGFLVIFRLSLLDLVEGGSTLDEAVDLAVDLSGAGASMINAGIGWHEARIPTIAASVPRAAFAWVVREFRARLRERLADRSPPVIATNRINDPALADTLIRDGYCDAVSMARPFLADPELIRKGSEGRIDEINPCIACNQACLDHLFARKTASCLVNPRAGRETETGMAGLGKTAPRKKRIAVIGAGPAGLAFAVEAARRGHRVMLFEAESEIGGQFRLARRIPGKEEFEGTIRYFARQLAITGVELKLGVRVDAEVLRGADADEIVLATGVSPRIPEIPGLTEARARGQAMLYPEAIAREGEVGERVAIIGAGGIGFDVAELLAHGSPRAQGSGAEVDSEDIREFLSHWGIDASLRARGGIEGIVRAPRASKRRITLLQRKPGRMGMGLGRTTGWIHRAAIRDFEVEMVSGAVYERIVPEGIEIRENGRARMVQADTLVVCAGQRSETSLAETLAGSKPLHVIGGAARAEELDAKRAIEQGTLLAARV